MLALQSVQSKKLSSPRCAYDPLDPRSAILEPMNSYAGQGYAAFRAGGVRVRVLSKQHQKGRALVTRIVEIAMSNQGYYTFNMPAGNLTFCFEVELQQGPRRGGVIGPNSVSIGAKLPPNLYAADPTIVMCALSSQFFKV